MIQNLNESTSCWRLFLYDLVTILSLYHILMFFAFASKLIVNDALSYKIIYKIQLHDLVLNDKSSGKGIKKRYSTTALMIELTC